MKCEFNYCIYNREYDCILCEIQINSFGMCEDCEIITVPEETIKKLKKKRSKEIEKIWKNE